MADEVVAFRAFRDLYLRTNPLGRRFIMLYYRFGPILAGIIGQRSSLKTTAQMFLTPLLLVIKLLPGVRSPRENHGNLS